MSNTGIVDNIAAAAGDASTSMRLHEVRATMPEHDEPFHRDSRAKAAFVRKCSVFSAILGSCTACSVLSWRRALSTRANSSSNDASLSFFQRFLVTPLIVPAAFGIGFVVYRCVLFEREFRSRERSREEWELQNFRAGEIDEMVRIYAARGLSREQSARLVEIVSSDDQFFVDTMMTDELGFSPIEPPSPLEALHAGAMGTVSYIAAAVLPLVAAHVVDDPRTHARSSYVPEAVLAATSLACSLLQAQLLLRWYTATSDCVWSVVANMGWIGLTYGVTTWSCAAVA